MNNRWWLDVRFGLFIHWGIYSVLAGVWKGKNIPGFSEWIMQSAGISPAEYATIARRFNPRKFDADQWVKLARDAGMQYVVFTAKHADGFAMYDSKCSDYNLMKATPFARDVVKELSQACRRAGLRFGLYYSQDYDLNEPGAGGYAGPSPRFGEQAMRDYVERKVKPQLRELLTQYGKVDLLWFDNPAHQPYEMVVDLKKFIRRLQPDCLINGRIGYGLGDYECMGDHQIPACPVPDQGHWEICAVMNRSWGYVKHDSRWESPRDLLRNLVEITSKGGVYLLNVGPDGLGSFAPQYVSRLKNFARWMKRHGESIHGAGPSPFAYPFPWGMVTTKKRTIYLHFFRWPRQPFVLNALRSKVRKVYVVGQSKRALAFEQTRDRASNKYSLQITLPKACPDKDVAVVAVELAGPIDVDGSLMQQGDGCVLLPANHGELYPATYWGAAKMSHRGLVSDWYHTDNWMRWTFTLHEPGTFDVTLVNKAASLFGWKGGHQISITVDDQELSGVAEAKNVEQPSGDVHDSTVWGEGGGSGADGPSPGDGHYPNFFNTLGQVTLKQPGEIVVALRSHSVNSEARGGLTVARVQLTPAVHLKR